MQSSIWSQYKHRNSVLIACTLNEAISFVSPVFVGSITDIELTRNSGFLTTLKNKPGVSIMADRGFTINQIVHVCTFLCNFQPALVPPPKSDMNDYIEGPTDSDSADYSDCEDMPSQAAILVTSHTHARTHTPLYTLSIEDFGQDPGQNI